MHHQNIKKSATTKGLAWGLFSATATISAFILPAFIFSFLGNNIVPENIRLVYIPIWILKLIVAVTLLCALYHSLYRVKTITLDLGFSPKTIKVTAFIANILIIMGTIAIGTLLIIS